MVCFMLTGGKNPARTFSMSWFWLRNTEIQCFPFLSNVNGMGLQISKVLEINYNYLKISLCHRYIFLKINRNYEKQISLTNLLQKSRIISWIEFYTCLNFTKLPWASFRERYFFIFLRAPNILKTSPSFINQALK